MTRHRQVLACDASITGTVTLDGPAPTGFPIVVSSSDASAAHAGSSVSFPSGEVTGTFSIITGQVPVDKTVTITVSNGGVSRSQSLLVKR